MKIRIDRTTVISVVLEKFDFYEVEKEDGSGRRFFHVCLDGYGKLGETYATTQSAVKKAREFAFSRTEGLAKACLEDKSYDLYGLLEMDQKIIYSFEEEE